MRPQTDTLLGVPRRNCICGDSYQSFSAGCAGPPSPMSPAPFNEILKHQTLGMQSAVDEQVKADGGFYGVRAAQRCLAHSPGMFHLLFPNFLTSILFAWCVQAHLLSAYARRLHR